MRYLERRGLKELVKAKKGKSRVGPKRHVPFYSSSKCDEQRIVSSINSPGQLENPEATCCETARNGYHGITCPMINPKWYTDPRQLRDCHDFRTSQVCITELNSSVNAQL